MPLGYHYTGKRLLNCRACNRRLARGEFFWGYAQRLPDNMPEGTCLKCKRGERFFTEAAAGRIIGVHRTTAGDHFRRANIDGAEKVGPQSVMIPLSWIMEMKAKHAD